MSRYIRWQGIVSFFAILALLAAFVYFFAESIVKNGIEYGGGHYLGAEVNVADVEINYNPLQIHIHQFQATDPQVPTQNTLSFAKASAGLDIWQYIFGKILIDELAIDSLEFYSKRQRAGKVYKDIEKLEEGEQEESLFSTPDISLPDPKTLLAEADLETIKRGQQLQASYEAEKTKLQALKAQLPSKEKLKSYQAQVKALGDVKVKSLADVEKLKADFDKIKQQFAADKAIVKKAKQQLEESKTLLSEQAVALKNGPADDWKNIESKYQLDKVDGADFAHILFGDKARDYYEWAQIFIEKTRPLMAGKSKEEIERKNAVEGRFVHFEEENPQPDLLINRARFSVISPQGNFNIHLDEVTHQHWYRNKPTTYGITSKDLMGAGQVNLNGEMLVDQNSEVTTQGKWAFSDVAVNDVALQESKKLTMTLDKATVAGSGSYSLNHGEIDATNNIEFAETAFSGGGESKIADVLVDTLKSMDTLALGANISGTTADPQWAISSPLDNLLENALSQQVNKQVDKFKGQVQAGLNDKLASALNLNEGASNEIIQFDALLNDTDGALESLLNSDVVGQQKDALQNKLEDKIKGKLGDLFN